jgi:hypothetical protein
LTQLSQGECYLRIMIAKETIRDKIEEIKITIDSGLKHIDNPYLMGGLGGIILFYNEYYKHKKDSSDLSKIELTLNQVIEEAFMKPNNYSFSYGLSGIGWLIEHLVNEKRLKKIDAKVFEQCDDYLMDIFKREITHGNYDYLHGSLGIALYFINKNKLNKRALNMVVDCIERIADKSNGICAWNTYDQKTNSLKINNYNLGLSHGIPSIISILNCLRKKEIQTSRCEVLIEGGCNLILKCKNSVIADGVKKTNSLFPYETKKFLPSLPTRLAWCYGDLGIASTLWQAGITLHNSQLKQEAVNIMLLATTRKNLSENGVIDAGICHGTAGIAHMFNLFYWKTKMIIFKEMANYWISETLKKEKIENDLAIYKSWDGGEQAWINNYGLLEGIAGIGLVLINHINDSEQNWDNCLLLH